MPDFPKYSGIGIAKQLFKSKKRVDTSAILNRYRTSRPVGYTSPEDLAASELTRTRMAGAAQAVAQQRRAQNARQVTARGLGGPAAAALEQQASDIAAGGAEEAARTGAGQLYRAFQSNLGYERSKSDTAFGAEIGLAANENARNDAADAAFWNGMLEVIPTIASGWGGGAPAASGTAYR